MANYGGRESGRLSREELTRQVQQMMTSSMDEGCKVIWSYLLVCQRGGLGRDRLDERLSVFGLDECLEVLMKEGRLRKRQGKYVPVLYGLARGEPAPRQSSVSSEITLMQEEYNFAIQNAGHPPLRRFNDNQFREIHSFLIERGITFEAYLEFALETWRGMTKSPTAFPLPSHLAGPFLQGRWGSMAPVEEKAGHAGFRYSDLKGVRAALRGGGFDDASRLSKSALRDIVNYAIDMVECPDDTPAPSGRYARETEFLANNMRPSDA